MPSNSATHTFNRSSVVLLMCSTLLALVVHLPSFSVSHNEGDEIAYLALAKAMHWDFTNYTTKDDPVASQYPFSIYQEDLFHHPPLFPYVLKLGDQLGDPLLLGLLLELLVYLLTLWVLIWELSRRGAPVAIKILTVGLFVSCPLLNLSTTRLHIDALSSLLMLVSLMLYREGVVRRSWRIGVGAGVLFALALNVRYSSLVFLAVAPLPILIHACGKAGPWRHRLSAAWREQWRVVLAVAVPIVLLGLPHYVRILWVHHSLFMSDLVQAYPERFNPFLRGVYQVTQLRAAIYLVLAVPVVAVLVLPGYWKRLKTLLGTGDQQALFYMLFPYLIIVCFIFQYNQLRYFSLAIPFCYFVMGDLMRQLSGRIRTLGVACVSLCIPLMAGTTYLVVIHFPDAARIVPIVVYVIKPLYRLYI